MNQLLISGCAHVEPASSTVPTERPRPERTAKHLRRKLPDRITLAELQNELAKELGEGIVPTIKRRSWWWGRKQLLKGAVVARHGWRLHQRPKPLFLHLEGYGPSAVLLMRDETGKDQPYSLSWADINECDWFAPSQLELAR